MAQKQNRPAFVRNLADPAKHALQEAIAAVKVELEAGNSIDCVSALGWATRILSLKLALVGHEDERIRSKSALLIGRELKSADWVMRRMLDPDPDV